MLLTFLHSRAYPYHMIQVQAERGIVGRIGMMLALCAIVNSALGVNFSFTGREGFYSSTGLPINGTLSLDLNDAGTVTPLPNGELGATARYLAPTHFLNGTYDLWSFSGTPGIYVSDGPSFWSGGDENMAADHWIVRTSVSGPSVNGWTPVSFGIFYYTSPAGINGTGLLPPASPLTSVNEMDFTFFLQLQNQSDELTQLSGPIFSLHTTQGVQIVPEPTAFTLLLAGGLILRALRQRRQ